MDRIDKRDAARGQHGQRRTAATSPAGHGFKAFFASSIKSLREPAYTRITDPTKFICLP